MSGFGGIDSSVADPGTFGKNASSEVVSPSLMMVGVLEDICMLRW